jgi:hypothetical protein
MSIFSRLFPKEEEGQAEAPGDAARGVPRAPAPPPLPASQPEAVLGASADKTTPMVVIEAPPTLPPPATVGKKPANDRTAAFEDRRPPEPRRPEPPRPAEDRKAAFDGSARRPPRSDRTIVGNPPAPEQPPAPVAAREAVPPPAPRRANAPRRKNTEGAVDEALDKLFSAEAGKRTKSPRDGVSTAADQAAVRATFEELAVGHVRSLRNMMVELPFCDSLAGWLDLPRAALRSLRKMAEPLEMAALCRALDAFAAALDAEAKTPGPLTAEGRQRLLVAYEPLVTAMPKAFTLEGERDRREPLLLPALLRQVPGLEPLMVQKLGAVGLGRLETLIRATAEEIAVVAELPGPVAAGLAAKMQELRATSDAAMGLDSPTARKALATEVRAFEAAHVTFEKAAAGWSLDARAAKGRQRRQRELAFLRILVALARAGEVDLARRLEMLPSATRIQELDRCLLEAGVAQN